MVMTYKRGVAYGRSLYGMKVRLHNESMTPAAMEYMKEDREKEELELFEHLRITVQHERELEQ